MNMDQIRAGHAIARKDTPIPGTDGGEVVKKIPALIRENGLLATLAFACETKREGWKNPGHHKVMEIVVDYLGSVQGMDVPPCPPDTDPAVEYSTWMTAQPSAQLRRHTEEIMAYLNFLRRFVRRG